jgi:hypothetical protein
MIWSDFKRTLAEPDRERIVLVPLPGSVRIRRDSGVDRVRMAASVISYEIPQTSLVDV